MSSLSLAFPSRKSLTNQILLSRTGKQLVHNFERARSTLGSTSVTQCIALERMERDRLLLTSAVEYGLSTLGYTSLKAEQMRAVESVLKGCTRYSLTPSRPRP